MNYSKIYSINNNENSIVLDEIPQTSINNKYGVIKINGKDGIINKKGKIVLQCAYNDIDINVVQDNDSYNNMNSTIMNPVTECPKERVVHRTIMHECPHICPIKTRIINHHVYRHTFTPSYTCCEENEYSNVYEPRCC